MENLEEKILKDIKTGKLKLRSKYVFLAEKLGLRSIVVLSIAITILILGLLLWYLKATESFVYLSFGSGGFTTFLQSFPYGLVVVFTLFIILAGFVIKKTDITTKIDFKYIAVALLVLVVASSTAFAFGVSGSNFEKKHLEFTDKKFVKPFFGPGFGRQENNITGAIVDIGNGYLLLEGPRGTVYLDTQKAQLKGNTKPQKGLFVVASGKNEEDIFWVDYLTIKPTTSLPFLRKDFEQKNDDSRRGPGMQALIPDRPDEKTVICIEECRTQGHMVRECVVNNCLK